MTEPETFNCSLYGDRAQAPSNFIYDEVYRSASCKQKYSTDPKYTYYNALLDMKHRLSE